MSNPQAATTGQKPLQCTALGWYYDEGGRRLGPFSNQEMQRRVQSGEVRRDQAVFVGWRKGDAVEFVATDLRYALGEPPEPAQSAGARPPQLAARTTVARGSSTERGRPGPDRRRHARQPRPHVVSCRGFDLDEPDCWRAAQVVDVSRGGISLLNDRRFEADAVLTLCFNGDGADTALLLTARVVRAERRSGSTWLLGCRFTPELGEREFDLLVERTGGTLASS